MASMQSAEPGSLARMLLRGVAACVLPLLGCNEEPPPPPEFAQRVEIVTFGERETEELLEYPGTVEASERAETSFEVAGRIIEFPVNEGDQVETGQVLARLDPSDFAAELAKQQALVNASRADFHREKKLLEEGVSSQQQFDVAKRNYQFSSAGLKIARKALADTELRAPFAGRVARKLVNQYQNVQAKEPVISFQSDAALEIRVAVPERDAVRMPVDRLLARRSDVRPEVIVSAAPERAFPAQLTEFATKADPTTRTFSATLSFSVPAEVNVLPGMTASVRIRMPASIGIGGSGVEAKAVFAADDGSPSVWIVDPESLRVSPRSVTVGELSGTEIRVTEGIQDGEWVAVTGVHQLREGMLVRGPDL